MATFFLVFLKIIEGGQNPGSTLAKAGPFSIPLAKEVAGRMNGYSLFA